jgi:hypothetical protein
LLLLLSAFRFALLLSCRAFGLFLLLLIFGRAFRFLLLLAFSAFGVLLLPLLFLGRALGVLLLLPGGAFGLFLLLLLYTPLPSILTFFRRTRSRPLVGGCLGQLHGVRDRRGIGDGEAAAEPQAKRGCSKKLFRIEGIHDLNFHKETAEQIAT